MNIKQLLSRIQITNISTQIRVIGILLFIVIFNCNYFGLTVYHQACFQSGIERISLLPIKDFCTHSHDKDAHNSTAFATYCCAKYECDLHNPSYAKLTSGTTLSLFFISEKIIIRNSTILYYPIFINIVDKISALRYLNDYLSLICVYLI